MVIAAPLPVGPVVTPLDEPDVRGPEPPDDTAGALLMIIPVVADPVLIRFPTPYDPPAAATAEE